MRRHGDHSTSYKEKHCTGVALWEFTGWALYCHGRKQGSMKADIVLERKALISQSEGNRKQTASLGVTWAHNDLKARLHCDTLPPTKPRLLIVPFPLGANFFQTSTHIYRILKRWAGEMAQWLTICFILEEPVRLCITAYDPSSKDPTPSSGVYGHLHAHNHI